MLTMDEAQNHNKRAQNNDMKTNGRGIAVNEREDPINQGDIDTLTDGIPTNLQSSSEHMESSTGGLLRNTTEASFEGIRTTHPTIQTDLTPLSHNNIDENLNGVSNEEATIEFGEDDGNDDDDDDDDDEGIASTTGYFALASYDSIFLQAAQNEQEIDSTYYDDTKVAHQVHENEDTNAETREELTEVSAAENNPMDISAADLATIQACMQSFQPQIPPDLKYATVSIDL